MKDHPGRVFMATLTNGHDLSARFVKSKQELEVYDREFSMWAWEQMGSPESPTPLELRLLAADSFIESGVNVSNRRNKAVQLFLEAEVPAEWLWFVDGDQVFEPDVLHRMTVTAHQNDVKILGALIPIVGPTGLISNLFVDHDEAVTHVVMDPFQEHFGEPGPKEFAATGSGCLLIHRDVLEAMYEANGDHISYFYEDRVMPPSGGGRRWMGEDLTFCLNARKLGFPVIVDTSIHVGHHKGVRTWWPSEIPHNLADPAAIEMGAVDNRHRLPQQPVATKTAVVIPVKDKLELTRDIVTQLRTDAGVSKIIVLDNGSTDGTWAWLDEQDDVEAVAAAGKNIHEMWNQGIELALADPEVTAVAVLNNDLDLGPDAITKCAEALARHPEYAAVCPNYDGRSMIAGHVHPTKEICAGRYDGTGGLAGFAMVIAADFLESYRFPEDCTWWYGDNDLVLTALKAGRKLGIVGGADIVHLDGGGQTGDWMSPELREVTSKDREVFMAKWAS